MAATLLCDIIAQAGKASADTFRERDGYAALIRRGLVKETGPVQSFQCSECSEPHDAEVIFEDGQYGYYCPEFGFVPLERATLIGITFEPQTLVAGISEALDCKRHKGTPVHGQTWRIGALETSLGDLAIYFHPRLLGGEDVRDLETALTREVKSAFRLILIAEGSLATSGAKSVRLDEVLELDPNTGELAIIADLQDFFEIPRKNTVGHPNRYREKVNSIIQTRIENGEALSGRNEEAKEILNAYRTRFPGEKPPSMPTIKRYLTCARGGS